MIYQQYPPVKALAHLVKFFYYFRSDDLRPERILPFGTTEISVYLDNPAAGIFVNNPVTRSYFVHPKALSGLVGVCLQPWAFHLLFHVPQSEISDQKVLMRDLLKSHDTQLTAKLNGKTHPPDMIHAVQEYLLAIAGPLRGGLVMDAVNRIDRENGALETGALARHYNLSERRLQQLFHSAIGLSPKKYSQLKRFHYSVSHLNPGTHLTELALNAGYYDQSHFIHEFNGFAGISPGGFLKEQKALSDINTKAYFDR
jgi:AraC-like DNA-binding protein